MGKPQVLIAGGGPAGVEAALALGAWAGGRLDVTLLTPDDHLSMPWLSVGGPFVAMPALRRPLAPLLSGSQATIRSGLLASVDREERTVATAAGEVLPYDRLLLATGAAARPFLPPPATSFGGVGGIPSVRALLDDVAAEALAGAEPSIAFVVPPGPIWPLPAYELAFGAAWLLEGAGARSGTHISLVTSEPRAVSLFGTRVSEAVAGDLASAGIRLVAGAVVREPGGGLIGADEEILDYAHSVVLPVLEGPRIPGLPADPRGFVRADGQGRIHGGTAEFVAGDASFFPVKQGGIACQQADAVASVIARELGSDCQEVPFDPVLRAIMWTGRDRRYMRAALSGGREELDGTTSLTDPLWSPETKVAGLFLSGVLGEASLAAPLMDRPQNRA